MRTHKHILVSVHYQGKYHWRLMSAKLVGKQWQVDANAFHDWLWHEIGIRERTTFTM